MTRWCCGFLILTLCGVAAPRAEAASKRVTVVKIKTRYGSRVSLRKAARLCRLYVEEHYRLVDESDFRDAADALGVEHAIWKPSNLTRIAAKLRLDAVVAVIVGRGTLQVGVVDGATGKMVEKVKLPFAGALNATLVSKLRQAIKDGVDMVVGRGGSKPRRRAFKDPNEVTPGKYSKVTEAQLMLTGNIETNLPVGIFAALYKDLGFNRFDTSIKANNPNIPAVKKWCRHATKVMQQRRGKVDGTTGEAIITLAAKLERCSQVFKHGLNVQYRCWTFRNKKGKSYMKCTVSAELELYKYKADQSTGKLKYSIDTAFGKRGKRFIKFADTSVRSITSDRPRIKAALSAIELSTLIVRMYVRRKLRDIKAFQLHAPILRAAKGWAFTCLDRATTELDTPFYVVFRGPKGEVRRGFAKARKIFDGCGTTLQSKTAKKAGKKFIARPMAAEIILGGSSVRTGMTIWEMPSIGLTFGGVVGVTSSMNYFKGNVAAGGGFAAEFNLAPYLKVSELHAFLTIWFGGNTKPSAMSRAIYDTFPFWTAGIRSKAQFAFQYDIGVIKRAYVAGPFFVEAALAISGSFHATGGDGDNLKTKVVGIGAAFLGGLGFQLAPRWILKLNAGYRVLAAFAMVKNDAVCLSDEDPRCGNDLIGAEHGIVSQLTLLYNW